VAGSWGIGGGTYDATVVGLELVRENESDGGTPLDEVALPDDRSVVLDLRREGGSLCWAYAYQVEEVLAE
jgi:hypothetical protein